MKGDRFGLRRVTRGLRRSLTNRWFALGCLLLTAVGIAAWLPVHWTSWTHQLIRNVPTQQLLTSPTVGITLIGAGGLVAYGLQRWRHAARRGARALERPPVRPLRWWLILVVAVLIAAVTAWLLHWLLEQAATAQDPSKARINAVRTALTAGAGLIGAVVLVLTARKQWLAEHTQRHTEADAAEQRVTELYSAAAEQLASDQAPVRLAGLYALERLAQNNQRHRQTIVNLLCSYLRMPFTPPAEARSTATLPSPRRRGLHRPDRREQDTSPLNTLLTLVPTLATASTVQNADQPEQELQVRLAAQSILTEHLRPDRDRDEGCPQNPKFWPDIDLDLTGAYLQDWNFDDCEVNRANFTGATFHGQARFADACFNGLAKFDTAQFTEWGFFQKAQFTEAKFEGTVFHNNAIFVGAHFHGNAQLGDARFHGIAGFAVAHFHNGAWFAQVHFYSRARFDEVHFHSLAVFDSATFDDIVEFTEAWARLDFPESSVDSTWPPGWTVREADPGDGRTGRWGILVPTEDEDHTQDGSATV